MRVRPNNQVLSVLCYSRFTPASQVPVTKKAFLPWQPPFIYSRNRLEFRSFILTVCLVSNGCLIFPVCSRDSPGSIKNAPQVPPVSEKRQRTPQREAKIRRVLSLRQKDLTLVLANIHDPHNVSAIYRSCDAFGVPKVYLYYTETAFPVLGAKSSASARKWVTSEHHSDPDTLMAALKAQGMKVYATSCTPEAKTVGELDLTIPTALVLGNEHRGVDQEFISRVDGEVYIPMYGMIQSFNVSVAAAVLLAEASRQRLAAGMYDSPRYTEEEYETLYNMWMAK